MALVCLSDSCADNADCVQLTDREFSVCKVICDSAGPVSFVKLKEATGLHQEIVSRILHRLMIHGLVEKTDGKYNCECSQ